MKNGKHTKPRYTAARSFKRNRGYLAIPELVPTAGFGFGAQILGFLKQALSKICPRVDRDIEESGASVRETSGFTKMISPFRKRKEGALQRVEDSRKTKELEEEMNKTHRNFGDMIKEATKKKPHLHGLPHS